MNKYDIMKEIERLSFNDIQEIQHHIFNLISKRLEEQAEETYEKIRRML